MITAKEHLENTQIWAKVIDTNIVKQNLIEFAEEYAIIYHESKVKELNLHSVSWQSEQLKTFLSKLVEEFDNGEVSWNTRDTADSMLKSF